LQAGGRRFDPDWLHQPESLPHPNEHSFTGLAFAPCLLFKNPEVLFLTLSFQAKLNVCLFFIS
jgi:hypothetical protein